MKATLCKNWLHFVEIASGPSDDGGRVTFKSMVQKRLYSSALAMELRLSFTDHRYNAINSLDIYFSPIWRQTLLTNVGLFKVDRWKPIPMKFEAKISWNLCSMIQIYNETRTSDNSPRY